MLRQAFSGTRRYARRFASRSPRGRQDAAAIGRARAQALPRAAKAGTRGNDRAHRLSAHRRRFPGDAVRKMAARFAARALGIPRRHHHRFAGDAGDSAALRPRPRRGAGAAGRRRHGDGAGQPATSRRPRCRRSRTRSPTVRSTRAGLRRSCARLDALAQRYPVRQPRYAKARRDADERADGSRLGAGIDPDR